MSEMPTTPSIAAEQPAPSETGRFTVIGSGVIGLLVAHELVEQGHDVTVISTTGKPHEHTTIASTAAVGQFLPWLPESHAKSSIGKLDLNEIVEGTRTFYEELAQDPHTSGVMEVENVELVNSSHPWPEDLSDVMVVTESTLVDPLTYVDPDGSEVELDTVYRFNTFSINTSKTVVYLADRAEKAGVKFKRQELKPEDLHQLDGIIVNAAGAGAVGFDPTNEVKNYKGHTFVMRPRAGYRIPKEALSVEDLIIMPREDGTLICGALRIEDPTRPIPERLEAEELKKRLAQLIRQASPLLDGLDPELLEHCDTLVHLAGYRVESSGGGIRIAPDEANERLLHAYGFGGIGWSVGPHFAKKIAEQAIKIHNNRKENA
ncbi:MAG TPA: FAD-dependent oxidoreductase [Candidatus Saccharimonadales bacterium]|nr:FAD-dependent oxidoreductase [Candidatus Saccharimonadales bacterium]